MKLLLDVHIPAAVVPALQRKLPGIDVAHVSRWRAGAFREAEDAEILIQCLKDKRVFVTYDLTTIPGLIAKWADEEISHAGILLADAKSIPPEAVGDLTASIAAMVTEIGGFNTTNLVRFLRRVPR